MTHDEIINEVHAMVTKEWSAEYQDAFFLGPWSDRPSLSAHHHTLGTYIRNKYNLWAIPWEPQIEEFMGSMCDCSPYHPDQVSMTIIKEVWKKGF